MSSKRLKKRVPSAKVRGTGKLANHNLKFHKVSKDGSGKCDICKDESNESAVYGVIFEIDEGEKPDLDKKEGLGYGYNEKEVEIRQSDGTTLKATTYYATIIDEKSKPYSWYKEHVVRGAREHGLPEDYTCCLEAIEATVDPDKKRHERELEIYRPV